MPEYIEREEALRMMKTSKKDKPSWGDWDIAHDCCIDCVNAAPTADVVEVKHGKNLTKRNPADEFICSECGVELCDITEFRIDVDNEDTCFFGFEVKFCPNCGARIKE